MIAGLHLTTTPLTLDGACVAVTLTGTATSATNPLLCAVFRFVCVFETLRTPVVFVSL